MSDTPASHSTPVVGDCPISPPGRSRVVQIMHGQRTGLRSLDAHEIPERDFNVVLRGGQDNNTQRWVLTDTGGCLYTIMQVSSDRYLDAHEIESLDFRVVTRPRQDNDTQLWRLLPSGGKVLIQQVSSGRALEPYLTQDMDFQVVTRPRNDNDDNQWLWEPLFDALGRTFAVDRSAQFNTPPTAGAPAAWLNPGMGVENIAYRTTALRLHLLTRDALGVTFVQPLTDLARTVDPSTPLAISSPFGFVDTNRNLNILLYVDQARMVHSLYWSSCTHPGMRPSLAGTSPPRAPRSRPAPSRPTTARARIPST